MHTLFNKESAINSLYPLAEYLVKDGEIIWLSEDIDMPSDEELELEIQKLQQEYESLQYIHKRRKEYPSIEECIHAILDNDLEALQAKRQAVKDKYPKQNT